MRSMKVLYGTVVLYLCTLHTNAVEELNETVDSAYLSVVRNGKSFYIREELIAKLDEELETWHWTPWLRTRLQVVDDFILREADCSSSLESFPDGLFTDEQLRQGAFLAYVLFGIYAFTLLAIVCNDFFIPCVELICEDLKIPQNVAAATFMAVATSCPEFFVNVISTFLTESDMGIGTIIGSAIFNALGVAAIGGLAAITPITIERRPVTRDVIIYMVNVCVLVLFIWDGQVDWYEALVLAIMYVLYFVIMFNSMRLFALYDRMVGNCCKSNSKKDDGRKSVEEGIANKAFDDSSLVINAGSSLEKVATEISAADEKPPSIFAFPSESTLLSKIWWCYTLPLRIILGLTIPSPVTRRKLYPLAFFMCIIWIGVNSYFVTWSMTVIGHTFFIPDSVMGMTFLAFGGCLPEACSIYIMSRKGEGGIGVSNALGANSLAILFALGLPWLIKSVALVVQGAEETAILINSSGIDFIVGSLLVAVACLWITLFIGKFTLRPSIGGVLLVLYIIFIIFAILIELGILFDSQMTETC